jgi:hypothetical protein
LTAENGGFRPGQMPEWLSYSLAPISGSGGAHVVVGYGKLVQVWDCARGTNSPGRVCH